MLLYLFACSAAVERMKQPNLSQQTGLILPTKLATAAVVECCIAKLVSLPLSRGCCNLRCVVLMREQACVVARAASAVSGETTLPFTIHKHASLSSRAKGVLGTPGAFFVNAMSQIAKKKKLQPLSVVETHRLLFCNNSSVPGNR